MIQCYKTMAKREKYLIDLNNLEDYKETYYCLNEFYISSGNPIAKLYSKKIETEIKKLEGLLKKTKEKK